MPTQTINGKKCYFEDVGEGFPILMGHSYMWTSAMWQPQIEHLSTTFRCITVDLWNHGRSESIASPTVESIADDMWKLVCQLGIKEFAMIGLSVGGMWGTHLALNHPEHVKALVLMDTYVGKEPEVTQKKYFSLLDTIERDRGFTPEIIEQVAPLFFSPHTVQHNPTLVENFRASLAHITKEQIPGFVALGRSIFTRKSLLDRLPSIEQPVLVMTGQDDIPRPPHEAEEMAGLLPHGSLHLVEKGGHICNLEHPDEVNHHLAKFLEKCALGNRFSGL